MGRDRFLRLLKKFDDNYVPDEIYREYVAKEIIKTNQTPKEFLSSREKTPLRMYSQIDYRRIKEVTANTTTFEPFYNLEDDELDVLFRTLHKTDLFLKYNHEGFFKKGEQSKRLSTNYAKVLEDLEWFAVDEELLNVLRDRKQSLQDETNLTQRKIFENLVFFVSLIFKRNEVKNSVWLGDKTAKICTEIIDKYFDKEDIKFSKSTQPNNFKEHYYYIKTAAKLTLIHS